MTAESASALCREEHALAHPGARGVKRLTEENAWQYGEQVFIRPVPGAWWWNFPMVITLVVIQGGCGLHPVLPIMQVPMEHSHMAHRNCRRMLRRH